MNKPTDNKMTRLALHASLALAEQQRDAAIAALRELIIELQHAFNDVPAGVDYWMTKGRAAIAAAESEGQ